MNRKKILVTLLTVIAGSAVAYFAFVKNATRDSALYVSQPPQTQTIIVEGRKLVDLTLKVDAPFSSATLIVQENGAVAYSAQQRGFEEIQDSGIFTKAQVDELSKLIEQIDFMKNSTQGLTDPEDGSTYTVSIRILPERDSSLEFPETYSVSCYQFSCEYNFLELRDKIKKFWNKKILEVGF